MCHCVFVCVCVRWGVSEGANCSGREDVPDSMAIQGTAEHAAR